MNNHCISAIITSEDGEETHHFSGPMLDVRSFVRRMLLLPLVLREGVMADPEGRRWAVSIRTIEPGPEKLWAAQIDAHLEAVAPGQDDLFTGHLGQPWPGGAAPGWSFEPGQTVVGKKAFRLSPGSI